MTDFFLNLIKQSTDESSMRFIFMATAIAVLIGLVAIDIRFAVHITKYSGIEVAGVIAANSAFLIAVIYGKNKAKTIETQKP